MKTIQFITLSLLAGGLPVSAQFNFNFAFDSGSTGSDGPLNVTTSTNILLPTNGVLNYTTINIATGVVVTFAKNPANTPVYLLAQGDVTIAGTINVSGFSPASSSVGGGGGPGGFDGGFPAFNGLRAGDGYGPGGGKVGAHGQGCWGGLSSAGAGSYATRTHSSYDSQNKGIVYGSPLLVPLVGGSGGGGTTSGYGGGGGGGAILIASSTRLEVTGSIAANGAAGLFGVFNNSSCGSTIVHVNPGSGGAIRLMAPVVVGSGSLKATGPETGHPVQNYGRIRVDSIDRRQIFFSTTGNYSIGTYMVTFPPSRLDIIKVGDTNIAVGSGPVAIQLPNDSDPNRAVTVQASNFNAVVTCVLALTPENGPSILHTNVLDNIGLNAVTPSTFNVTLPVNTIVTISAWTQ